VIDVPDDHLPGLLPHHLRHLRESGLTDATILAAGIRSETSPDKLAILLGWRKPRKGMAPAIVYPFVGADGANGYYRVRPDTPRLSAGKPVKYESPRERPNQVYLPPGVARVLDDPTIELVITEGEKKSLAITQDGPPCIGLVGVYGWREKRREQLLPELERIAWQGRRVAIVYDSDIARKPDGQAAESRLAKLLKDRGAIVRCVRLPDGPPDADGAPTKMGADDYIVAHGPAALAKVIAEAVEPEPPEAADAKDHAANIEPAQTAAGYLASRQADGMARLCHHRGSYWLWHAGRYVETEASEVRADVIRALNQDYIHLTTSVTANVMAQVQAQAMIPSMIEPPAWLGDAPPVDWSAADILTTRRELVHLPSLVDGSTPHRLPATPRLLTHTALDYDFASDAPEPTRWLALMRELWPGDPESIAALQEWMGYLLTPDTRQQKILMLIGPPRSGKGTIARVIETLVGRANVAGPTLASLAGTFGLAPLLGKSVAIVADARLSSRIDQCVIVERLLSISGEDTLTADRKYREPVTAKISARLMMLSNELPRLAEASGALANRMIVLRLTESYLGREDTALTATLRDEMPGILLWAIAGWQRLRERGRFAAPASGRELSAEMADLCSPVGMYLRERCLIGPQYRVAVDDMYAGWRDWCAEQGREHPGTLQTLGRDLRAAVPSLSITQPRVGGRQVRVYSGVGIAR
jgi:putative DNA primase/helicase